MTGHFRFKAVLVVAAAFALFVHASAQTQAVDALEPRALPASEVLDAALERATAEEKNVLVHFGASWCTWCRHLDAMLESDEVGGVFRKNFVITHLTIQESADKVALENPGAEEMLLAAGAGDAGVPVYIIYDSRGNQLATSLAMPKGRNIGHPVTPEEIEAFLGLLDETAPRMTAADRALVAAYLSNQRV